MGALWLYPLGKGVEQNPSQAEKEALLGGRMM